MCVCVFAIIFLINIYLSFSHSQRNFFFYCQKKTFENFCQEFSTKFSRSFDLHDDGGGGRQLFGDESNKNVTRYQVMEMLCCHTAFPPSFSLSLTPPFVCALCTFFPALPASLSLSSFSFNSNGESEETQYNKKKERKKETGKSFLCCLCRKRNFHACFFHSIVISLGVSPSISLCSLCMDLFVWQWRNFLDRFSE